MSQAALFLVLHVVGVSLCLAFGPRRRIALCCALGFPVGLAALVAISLLLRSLGLGYGPITAAASAAALLALGIAVASRRGRPERRGLAIVVAWTAAFAAVCVAVTPWNLSLLWYDGQMLVLLGHVVAHSDFAPGVVANLGAWGVFGVIAQSGAAFTAESYLYSLPTVLGLSAIPLFAVTLGAGLEALGVARRAAIAPVALITAALFTIYMVHFHFFYLHNNLASAVYLLIFVSLFWLAEVERDAAALPVAFLALLGFALQRIENPVAAPIFIAFTVLHSRLPRRALLVSLGGYTAAIAGWYLLLGSQLSAAHTFLTPRKCLVIVAISVGMLAYATAATSPRLPWLARLDARLAVIAAVIVAIALAVAFADRPDHMAASARAWATNLGASRYWAGGWWAIVALAIVGLWVPAPPSRQAFVATIPLYLALILLLAHGRVPYRVGEGDSATRMSIHVVPLLFFYFGIKLVPAGWISSVPSARSPSS